MSEPRPDADLHAEREVELRSAWTRVTARWWLPVAGAVLGAVLGVLSAASGGQVYEAKALLYLGQPFTPGGGSQIQSLQTNPKTVSEILRQEAVIERASKASGLTRAQLRGNVTSAPITVQAGATARNLSPLVEIEVQAPNREKAQLAAESFAESVVRIVSPYVLGKTTLLESQISADEAQLERLDARIANVAAQQRQLSTDTSIPLAERLVALQGVNSNLSLAEQQRTAVQAAITSNRQLLVLASQVEKTRLMEEVRAAKASATSNRTALVMGAIIGLLLGALAAIVLDPILRRRQARTEP